MAPTPPVGTFENLLGDWSDREVFEAQEHMTALLGSPGWEVAMRLISEERAKQEHVLINAGIREQVEYVAVTSRLRGLDQLAAIPEVILKVASRRAKEAEAAADMEADMGQRLADVQPMPTPRELAEAAADRR